jgi:hypothetical protein
MREREKVFIVGLFSRFPTAAAAHRCCRFSCDLRAIQGLLMMIYIKLLPRHFFIPPLCQSNTHMLTNFRTQATFFASRDERRGRVASRPEGLWERLFGADIYFYSSQQHRTFLANPLGN